MTVALAPIYSMAAERSVLGAAFRDPLIVALAGALPPSAFYDAAHGAVWDAMQSLTGERKRVDVVLVADRLARSRRLDAVGGEGFLVELEADVGTTVGWEHHVRVIRERAALRTFAALGLDLSTMAYAPDATAASLRTFLDQALLGVDVDGERAEPRHLGEVLGDCIIGINDRAAGRHPPGFSTGLMGLDLVVGVLRPTELVVVGGRPGSGKSALVVQLAEECARQGGDALVFSLEMDDVEIGDRMLAGASGIPLPAIRNAALKQDAVAKLARRAEALSKLPLWIDKRPLTLSQVAATTRRFAARRGGPPAVVVVDYLQLVPPERDASKAHREEQVAAVSRGLKRLAKELSCVVIAAAQLNRESEKRGDGKPRVSDLRESGSIEADANVILLPHREKDETGQWRREAVIVVGKQRNGPPGEVEVDFHASVTRFTDRLLGVMPDLRNEDW